MGGGFPGTIDHPSDSGEGKGRMGGRNCHETKKRYGCGRTALRPEVNRNKGKGWGKEWEVHEWG